MPKKTDDPALDRAVRVFWVVSMLSTFVVMVLSAVWGGDAGSPAQKLFLSVFVGISFGLLVGSLVYVAGERNLRSEERRKIQEQQRDVQRRADDAVALGPRYALIVETTLATVRDDIRNSEAARAGLLGDVDFDADIRGVTENLKKAHALQKVADTLAALDNPSSDDRKILADANTTVSKLETAALNRVELIAQCATEAKLVDKSLQDERKEAKTSAQRAELHAELAAMLYGIEATPDTTPTDSAASSVLLRVRAYREIKNQIRLFRD
jgi:hypothetical protein